MAIWHECNHQSLCPSTTGTIHACHTMHCCIAALLHGLRYMCLAWSVWYTSSHSISKGEVASGTIKWASHGVHQDGSSHQHWRNNSIYMFPDLHLPSQFANGIYQYSAWYLGSQSLNRRSFKLPAVYEAIAYLWIYGDIVVHKTHTLWITMHSHCWEHPRVQRKTKLVMGFIFSCFSQRFGSRKMQPKLYV